MITAFFLAHSHTDCHNFILLKKQCMLQYSENIPHTMALVSVCKWLSIPIEGESGCAVIITVDVTVV